MKKVKTLGQAVAAATIGMTLTAGAMAGEVNIGFTGPLSGGAALYGENTLSGLRMAAEEINAAGGFDLNGEKTTINLVSLDDRYSPAQAATNAKRLKQESNVPAVFIPHSGGVFALQDFNEKDDFLIMAYTSVPTVTEKGNSLTLRIPPTFDGYVRAFTDYALEHAGKTLGMAGGMEMVEGAIGVVPLSVYETEAAKSFIERYQDKYGKIPGSEAAYNYLALHGLVEAMDATESTDPKVIRGAIGNALANMDSSKNPYEVSEVTDKGGFVTETTLAVVKDGKIVREPIE
ncbi:MAG: ABC transporter substrate-binding protein [Marinobacter sp.]|uniref:ABC transporter substrate-binding protein n=1 Tax=Marinobacter sp. TaxID=50741 RepID=UPI00396E52F3